MLPEAFCTYSQISVTCTVKSRNKGEIEGTNVLEILMRIRPSAYDEG